MKLLLLAVLSVGCGSVVPESWTLVEIDGMGVPAAVADTLILGDDGDASLARDGSRWGGSWTSTAATLDLEWTSAPAPYPRPFLWHRERSYADGGRRMVLNDSGADVEIWQQSSPTLATR